MSASHKSGILATALSALAAAFGVQSTRNQERDFQHGNIWAFIVAGLVFTALFVIGVYSLVQSVLPA